MNAVLSFQIFAGFLFVLAIWVLFYPLLERIKTWMFQEKASGATGITHQQSSSSEEVTVEGNSGVVGLLMEVKDRFRKKNKEDVPQSPRTKKSSSSKPSRPGG